MFVLPLKARLALKAAVVCFGILAATGSHAQSSFDRDKLIEAARKEGQLVFYSTIPDEQTNQILARFEKKYPFVKTSSFCATSGRIGARLDAEIGAGKVFGDILQMGSVGRFLAYAKAGNLERFETPEMNAYAPEYKEQGLWTVFRFSPILVAYDTRRVQESAAPTSWKDLADPKFKGRVVLLDATSGGQQSHWYALKQYLGNDFWKSVADNGAVAVSGVNRAMDSVLTGEFDIAGHAYGYTINSYLKNGAPIKQVLPKEGIPIMISPIAILKGGPNPNASRLFIDWLLSKEGQADVVNIMNDYSPRADAPSPRGLPPFKDLKVLTPPSWQAVADAEKQFGAEWNSLFSTKR